MTVTDSQVAEFHSSLMVYYGYTDVETAIEKFAKVKLSAGDLADVVRECADFTGTALDKIDVCYVAYDHILQTARNKLDEIIHFDICNDIKGGTEFYTAGSHMGTSFDYSQGAVDQLEERLRDAGPEKIEELLENDFVKVFLEDVDIDIKEIRKQEMKKQ